MNSREGDEQARCYGRHCGAQKLRQARCLSRGAHPRCVCRGRRTLGSVRCGTRRLAAKWLPAKPRGLAADRGPAQDDRYVHEAHAVSSPPPIEMQVIDEALAAPTASEIPDERLAMMFACAHPSIDAGSPRPADAAGRAGTGRHGRSPRPFWRRRRPWASGWCEPRRRFARPASRSAFRGATNFPPGWTRF